MAQDPNDPNAAPKAPATPSPGPGWVQIGGGWVPPDHPLAQAAGQGTNPAPQPPDLSQPTPQTPAGGATPAPAQNTPQLFQQSLNGLLSRSTTPQATDPEIALPLAAERRSEDESLAKQRAFLAEKANADGTLGAGGFNTGVIGLQEDSAGRKGAYEGDLYRTTAQDRIQQQLSALGLAGNTLDANAKNALGKSALDLQNRSLDQNQNQFDTSTSQREGEFNANMNYNSLLALLQGLS